LLGESNLFIKETWVENCIAYETGGAIFASSFDTVAISENTNFLACSSIGVGSSLYLIRSFINVTISDTKFNSPKGNTHIHIDDVKKVQIVNSEFGRTPESIADKGGAIHILNVPSFMVSNSRFIEQYAS